MNKLLVKTKLAKDKFREMQSALLRIPKADQIIGLAYRYTYCCCSRRVLHEKLSGRNRGGLGRSNR